MNKVRVTEIQGNPMVAESRQNPAVPSGATCVEDGGHMSRECRKEGRRCFACGEVGHMHVYCPGKQGAQSSGQGQGKKGH